MTLVTFDPSTIIKLDSEVMRSMEFLTELTSESVPVEMLDPVEYHFILLRVGRVD